MKLHVLEQSGVGVSGDTLDALRACLPSTALRIGICSHAFEGPARLVDAIRCAWSGGQEIHLLIGCEFGSVRRVGSALLPVNLVEEHIRVGRPFVRVSASMAAAFTLGLAVSCLEGRELAVQEAPR